MPMHGSHVFDHTAQHLTWQQGANGDSCNQCKAMSTAGDASPQNIARANRNMKHDQW